MIWSSFTKRPSHSFPYKVSYEVHACANVFHFTLFLFQGDCSTAHAFEKKKKNGSCQSSTRWKFTLVKQWNFANASNLSWALNESSFGQLKCFSIIRKYCNMNYSDLMLDGLILIHKWIFSYRASTLKMTATMPVLVFPHSLPNVQSYCYVSFNDSRTFTRIL